MAVAGDGGSGEEEDEEPACNWRRCRKSFTRKSDLIRHARIHTNERYVSVFGSLTSLAVLFHLSPLPSRPFACEHIGCGKSFIQRSALTVHTRVQSVP
jgi:uncharacterized Zn-finger protein